MLSITLMTHSDVTNFTLEQLETDSRIFRVAHLSVISAIHTNPTKPWPYIYVVTDSRNTTLVRLTMCHHVLLFFENGTDLHDFGHIPVC